MERLPIKTDLEGLMQMKTVLAVIGMTAEGQFACMFSSQCVGILVEHPEAFEALERALREVVDGQLPKLKESVEAQKYAREKSQPNN